MKASVYAAFTKNSKIIVLKHRQNPLSHDHSYPRQNPKPRINRHFSQFGMKFWCGTGGTRYYINSKNKSNRKAFGYIKIVGGKVEIWESKFTDAQDALIETAINKIIIEMVAEDGAEVASKTKSEWGAETFQFDENGRFISKYSNIGIGN